jgi:hypothetical protein
MSAYKGNPGIVDRTGSAVREPKLSIEKRQIYNRTR